MKKLNKNFRPMNQTVETMVVCTCPTWCGNCPDIMNLAALNGYAEKNILSKAYN